MDWKNFDKKVFGSLWNKNLKIDQKYRLLFRKIIKKREILSEIFRHADYKLYKVDTENDHLYGEKPYPISVYHHAYEPMRTFLFQFIIFLLWEMSDLS